MSCPHTETTAILAAFGEAPPDFEAHLEQCPACLQVVRQHTSTLAMLEPVLLDARVQSKRWSRPSVGFLIAACALLALQFAPHPEVEKAPSQQKLTMEVDLFDDSIDENLTSIELEIELFHLEES